MTMKETTSQRGDLRSEGMVTGDELCRPTGSLDVEEAVEQEERFGRLCKALGHPARVRIVRLLLSVDTCVCGDIVERLPLAQSTVSQHLKVLKEAGIVEGVIDGPRTCYGVNREALAELKNLTDTLL
jgi:ArsR family transcriptional regulator